ncbi:16S rRNA (guanine(1207)-N(2))-methyltransferase [Saliniradius amylolyticus]|uniref:Ribosomal RNA small subunit methyltransferase C n=1 Tax=Saliniradius amylolyticus TaxID=2183582 RepID=A0A2S2DZU7_9ALTE|nr:methyltransferase [Saliniradius amylolyticus]AWL10812.1 16S rRNA (guanine(1207)-N(2))-methyltransferase [Saliniradius amylolyticus]
MLSNPSQLLLRHADLYEEGRWLIANPEDAAIFSEVKADGFHLDYRLYQQAKGPGQHHFGVSLEVAPDKLYDGAVLYMPKAKALAQMLLANLSRCIKPGGTLVLIGDNKGGVKSAPKLLAPYSDICNKLDSARRCSLYAAPLQTPAQDFTPEQWLKTLDVSVAGQKFQVAYLPGVFSAGELDPGTKLLLENADVPARGKVLDFACGCGVVACYLGKTNPRLELTLSDVSALALYSSEHSLALNGLEGEVLASDGLSSISGQFDAVLTNPPFHTGLKTDYDITEQFLARIPTLMTPRAKLQLVANSFLKYAPTMQAHLSRLSIVAETSKFRVYVAEKRA